MNENEMNLVYMKNLPFFPFRNFKTDEYEYMCLELYWVYLFKCVVGSNENSEWSALYAPDSEREGNPIFSAINTGIGRCVRVIHAQKGEGDKHYSEGGDYYPFQPFLSETSPERTGKSMPELCFVADLSQECERHVRTFLQAFCVELRTEASLEEMIRAYEVDVGMRKEIEVG